MTPQSSIPLRWVGWETSLSIFLINKERLQIWLEGLEYVWNNNVLFTLIAVHRKNHLRASRGNVLHHPQSPPANRNHERRQIHSIQSKMGIRHRTGHDLPQARPHWVIKNWELPTLTSQPKERNGRLSSSTRMGATSAIWYWLAILICRNTKPRAKTSFLRVVRLLHHLYYPESQKVTMATWRTMNHAVQPKSRNRNNRTNGGHVYANYAISHLHATLICSGTIRNTRSSWRKIWVGGLAQTVIESYLVWMPRRGTLIRYLNRAIISVGNRAWSHYLRCQTITMMLAECSTTSWRKKRRNLKEGRRLM